MSDKRQIRNTNMIFAPGDASRAADRRALDAERDPEARMAAEAAYIQHYVYRQPQRAVSEALEVPEDLREEIMEAYEYAVGGDMPVVVQRAIVTYYCRCGMAGEVIVDAIQQTGLAPRPSPRYLMAILRRYAQRGILDREALDDDIRKHEEAKRAYDWRR